MLQKRSDIDALRRSILRTAELYNYKNPVQHNIMLFLLFYIIIILASISVQIMAIANIGGRVGVIVGVTHGLKWFNIGR